MKRILHMMLAFCMMAAIFLAVNPTQAEAASPFTKGKGTKSNPYVVSTYKQLKKVKNYPGRYFVQSKNINCGSHNIKGIFGDCFEGNYNGKGYTISNFKCINPDGTEAFLIEEVAEDAVIKNLTFANGRFNADEKTALVGANYGKLSNVSIKKCTYTAGVTYDAYAWAAPLCYKNYEILQSCKVSGTKVAVNSDSWLGASIVSGLASINYGTIKSCKASKMTFSANSVQFLARIGGLVVYNTASGTVSRCSVSLAKKATCYGDKNGSYGTAEYGLIGRVVYLNEEGGLVRSCSVTGNFKADQYAKNIYTTVYDAEDYLTRP